MPTACIAKELNNTCNNARRILTHRQRARGRTRLRKTINAGNDNSMAKTGSTSWLTSPISVRPDIIFVSWPG